MPFLLLWHLSSFHLAACRALLHENSSDLKGRLGFSSYGCHWESQPSVLGIPEATNCLLCTPAKDLDLNLDSLTSQTSLVDIAVRVQPGEILTVLVFVLLHTLQMDLRLHHLQLISHPCYSTLKRLLLVTCLICTDSIEMKVGSRPSASPANPDSSFINISMMEIFTVVWINETRKCPSSSFSHWMLQLTGFSMNYYTIIYSKILCFLQKNKQTTIGFPLPMENSILIL